MDQVDSIESLATDTNILTKTLMKVIAWVPLVAGAAPIPKIKKPEPGPEFHPAVAKSHKGGFFLLNVQFRYRYHSSSKSIHFNRLVRVLASCQRPCYSI